MIRAYNTKDKTQIIDILRESEKDAHAFLGEEYISGELAVFGEYLEMAETFVYEGNGSIKGFISVLDKDFIFALCVDKDSRGQGIGKKLAQHCKNTYKSLEATVYAENEGAVEFFEKCGLHKKYETEDEDTGKMVISLGWIGMLEER